MGLRDIRKGLKATVGQVGGLVKDIDLKSTVDQVGNKVKSIDLKSTVEQVEDRVKDIDLKSTIDQVGDKVKSIDLKSAVDQIGHKTNKEQTSEHVGKIATISALRVLYFLIASDGQIAEEEMEAFRQMAEELNPHYAENLEAIIKSSEILVQENAGKPEYYEIIQNGVEKAVHAFLPTEDSFMLPKLLIWDMMTIAYSDNSYDENEKKLIEYTAELLNIDHTIYLELLSSLETLNDLEEELKWIKTTDRPYLTIEAMVNEIADRKNVIFESVKDLIVL